MTDRRLATAFVVLFVIIIMLVVAISAFVSTKAIENQISHNHDKNQVILCELAKHQDLKVSGC